MKISYIKNLCLILLYALIFKPINTAAQTEIDALFMPKNNLCVAASFGESSWRNYWEGTFKRDNLNIGRLTTQTSSIMLNYGLSQKINLLASIPYIATNASRGTLTGFEGLQDYSLAIKYKALEKQMGKQKFSVFTTAGYSSPLNDYNIDLMPLTIGLGNKVMSARLITDYQLKKFFTTLSASYLIRSNVEIDRSAYFTTRQINSNEVDMPNAGNFQLHTGFRGKNLIAEAFIDNFTTFGGFDIRKNDMPFVSNKMNFTRAGIEAKYYLKKMPQLGFHTHLSHTLTGRNVGDATSYMAGIQYIVGISKNKP